jgi:hypothetical protein
MLTAAGILAIVVGVIHSILGEVLIFRRLRKGTFVPTISKPLLLEKHIRILWATWHIATIFGWGMGAILLLLSQTELDPGVSAFVVQNIAVAMFSSGVLVLVATKAKHPGWIGLMGVGVLCWMA